MWLPVVRLLPGRRSKFQCLSFPLFGLCLVLAVQSETVAPPANMGRPFEETTNKTIDELITGTYGSVDVASNLMMFDEGYITAELDMKLSTDQFLHLYQPPSEDFMLQAEMIEPPVGMSLEQYKKMLEKSHPGRHKRKAVRETRLRWTNSEIPYLFAKGHFDEKEEYMMKRAMTEWERYTCVKFRPATGDDRNSLRFQNGVGCNSQLGMVGGIQILNLQAPGCRFKGLYLHEIGHALGLVHEHQLPNRDKFIRILYSNVSPQMRIWFNKYTESEVNQMDVKYEYSSVMHYGITAFSYNGEAQTIESKDPSKEASIGRVYLKELAYSDVHIVNKMYNCSGHCPNANQCGPDGHLDQNCNCICRDGSHDCDKTKQKTDSSCVNNYDSWACYIWANQGECERNSKYMSMQCAKACGVCGKKQDKKDTHFILWPWLWFPTYANMFPPGWGKLGICKDVYQTSKCEVWKERGDCITNQGWMKDNCPATCNLCGDVDKRPEVTCANSHDNDNKCRDWARDGECMVNPKWMFDNCQSACGMCLDGSSTGTGKEPDEEDMKCTNTHDSCETWARSGECSNNPSWMIPNCRQACDKCDDETCKNLYDDTQCEIWAQKQECLTNAQWMGKNCARECGRGHCQGVVTDGSTRVTVRPTRKPTRVTTARPTSTSGSCKNKHTSDTECEIWANNDHCSINPSWMYKNCARACRVCTGDRSETGKGTSTTDSDKINRCHDQESGCPSWAKSGYCDQNPRYTLVYCKKSCNNCNGCRDTEFLCKVWANDGHCEKNPRYMMRHCQKSCKACFM